MRQKTILVLFGGCSTEHDISLQSAQGVLEHMDRSRWLPLMVGITCQGEWLCYNGPVSAIGDGSWEQDRSHCTPCTLSLDRGERQLLLLDGRVSRVSFDGAFPSAPRQKRGGRHRPGPAGAGGYSLCRLRRPIQRPVHGQGPGPQAGGPGRGAGAPQRRVLPRARTEADIARPRSAWAARCSSSRCAPAPPSA